MPLQQLLSWHLLVLMQFVSVALISKGATADSSSVGGCGMQTV